jgi:hypothetical protein
MTGIGVIANAGVIVNNNIVLIDTYDRPRREGIPCHDPIIETWRERARPVVLTAVTAILGGLPIAFGINIEFVSREITVGAPATQWWIHLSTAIVFGLGFATVLTLIVTPAALMAIENMREWRLRWTGRWRGGAARSCCARLIDRARVASISGSKYQRAGLTQPGSPAASRGPPPISEPVRENFFAAGGNRLWAPRNEESALAGRQGAGVVRVTGLKDRGTRDVAKRVRCRMSKRKRRDRRHAGEDFDVWEHSRPDAISTSLPRGS